MIMDSFLDELVKLGGLRCLFKQAYGGGGSMDPNAASIPEGMMGEGEVPAELPTHPDDATTRLPATGHLPSAVQSGHLGQVTPAKEPIDKDKFNRLKFLR